MTTPSVLVSTTDENFDIFLSYKWENVDQVKILQEKLMKECGIVDSKYTSQLLDNDIRRDFIFDALIESELGYL